MKIKILLIWISTVFLCVSVSAQLQNLKGKIINNSEVEGIHILNKTALKYTVTNKDGSFVIPVKTNDTLTFSGVKYKAKEIVITQSIIFTNNLELSLEENVTQLDQVVVGKILTGNIESDLKNQEIEVPINFYDLGIPGYTGKQKTLSERKLAAATSGGGIPLIAIINVITGRTKELKERVKLDKSIICVERLKSSYKDLIFEEENLSEVLQNRFFNFIMDSEKLDEACNANNVLYPITFLKEELQLFKTQLTLDDKKD
ncbi:carboxypeptidase-like regulatory domain-containing protein [Winogradskyella jejuensis]|uniref:CarboxypepD_reg-like domain-containing protein n=1 Tax=Winogradskyella jejuensis TaxID=1089305 RepID=A0A1M5L3Q1_9FLAO|nr:carboxypeptidase-like regulatory domain-containing protein [Winogradskyella jejuensis]SHG59722.1 CarboxypepD_reg-like domain-containing protein [Winogradskyella jejuensis]